MTAAQDRSIVSSVVFLEFVDYTRKPVAEQIALKERLNALLTDALSGIAAADRIILDASAGAAISFIDDPENALFVAMDLRDAIAADRGTPKLEVRIGVNTGAVKLVKDAHGVPNIVGDGIDVAQRVMHFAEPGTVLASRAFSEVASLLSQDHARLFRYEGARTDHHIREHEVFLVGAAPHGPPVAGKRRQRLWLFATLASALILALAAGIRANRSKPPTAPEPAAAVAPVAAPPAAPVAVTPSPGKVPKTRLVKAKSPTGPAVTSPAPAAAAAAPAPPPAQPATGQIGFAITPWGEVYVDGTKRGVSPPLREVQIAPGKHTIEVRNTSFLSYSTTVEVTAGGQAKVRYKFQ